MESNTLDYVGIGRRIRVARNKKGLQQSELAYLAGLTSTHMSHIETGNTKPSLPTLVRIANVLSVSLDELMCDCLEQVTYVYNKQVAEELADCNAAELKVILEMIRSTKHAIREAVNNT